MFEVGALSCCSQVMWTHQFAALKAFECRVSLSVAHCSVPKQRRVFSVDNASIQAAINGSGHTVLV
jgi:hypothetical protein